MICKELADYLRFLADKYENESFFDGDPSFSLKKYTSVADTECAAFIAAVLSFGRRDQFLKKIEYIFSWAILRNLEKFVPVYYKILKDVLKSSVFFEIVGIDFCIKKWYHSSVFY